jgi:hypothetical protein
MTPGAPLRQHLPFAGRPWLAMSRLLPGPAAAHGRLLLLLPEESDPTP